MKLHFVLVLLTIIVFGCRGENLEIEINKSSEEQLVKYLSTSSNSDLRLAVAKELAGRKNYTIQILPEVIDALDDPNPLIREYLLLYLGNTGYKLLDITTLNKLDSILLNDTSDVSIAAAKTIAKIGSLHSIPALNSTIQSRDDDGVRLEAMRAIISLGGAKQSILSFIIVLSNEDDLATKQLAVEGLAAAGQDAVCAIPILISYLDNEDLWFRTAVAKSIAEISGEDFEINNKLDEKGIPKIITEIQMWWKASGQYKMYPACDALSSIPRDNLTQQMDLFSSKIGE
jgi:HEAT repeat protein